MPMTSTLRWVSTTGFSGGDVSVTVVDYVANPAVSGKPITYRPELRGAAEPTAVVTGRIAAEPVVRGSSSTEMTSTLRWVTAKGVSGGEVTVTVTRDAGGSPTGPSRRANGFLDFAAQVTGSAAAGGTSTSEGRATGAGYRMTVSADGLGFSSGGSAALGWAAALAAAGSSVVERLGLLLGAAAAAGVYRGDIRIDRIYLGDSPVWNDLP